MMELIADRFVLNAPPEKDNAGCAIDLATSRRVRIVVSDAGTAADQRAWLIACDEQQRVRRFSAPRLLDYGRLGEARRFEAWIDPPSAVDVPNVSMPTITLLERRAVAAMAELFELADDRRPRIAACWGPRGSGRRSVVEQLARIARLRGFVPVEASLLDRYLPLMRERALFVVDTSDGGGDASPWLRLLLRSPRAHLCLLVRSEETTGVDGFALDRMTVDELVAAVPLTGLDAATIRRVRRAAESSHGLPGRFVRTLWGVAPKSARAPRPISSRVAEHSSAYGFANASSESPVAVVPPAHDVAVRVWPAPGELAALRRRAAAAAELIAAGRHAPGIRALRQAMSALARRDAWKDATQSAVTLASALLARGRPRDALRALDDAREWVARASDPAALLDVAVCAGVAWTDLTRLDEAERVLSGAVATARTAGDHLRSQAAATALSRCMFWRGQYGEAMALLDGDVDPRAGREPVRRFRSIARAAVALGESARALEAVEAARKLTADRTDHRLTADVEYTAACVRLAVGDLEGVDRDVCSCLAVARGARHPVRAFAARLLKLEADRRRGRIKDVAGVDALGRLATAAPPIVRARFDLLRALIDAPNDRAVLRRHTSASGLKALELFGDAMPRSTHPTDPFVDDIVGILHVCQHADDERAVLRDVCGRVRDQIHAATVGFVATIDRRLEVLVADGPRMEADIAGRAIAARLTITPHRVGERLEAAAPVYYGGNVIGALCARWTVGTPYDLSRVGAVLSMAATAAAPVLSSVLVKRAQASPTALLDLLGATPAIVELREAIDRSAPAPFPVLIDGESGSGKELVARAVHRCGGRRDRPFATLNCAALPDDLVEAELFGHTRGAFTGAVADRPGVFEEAHGGTLFLDEVGELSPRAQAKLLRIIQEGELRRIGENLSRRVDVRIVCATNRNLKVEAEAGRFRQDLLYRLDVIRIFVPPLRQRREDIPVLVDHYWAEATRRLSSRATLSAETRTALTAYDWPGNVRELQNVLAAMAVRSPKRGVVQPAALPPHVAAANRHAPFKLDAARRRFEEEFVRAALARSGGRRTRAAADLGLSRQGLNKLMTRLGIE